MPFYFFVRIAIHGKHEFWAIPKVCLLLLIFPKFKAETSAGHINAGFNLFTYLIHTRILYTCINV